MLSRDAALAFLLRPLNPWPMDSAISKVKLAQMRVHDVHTIIPFLSSDEQKQAYEWLKQAELIPPLRIVGNDR